MVQKSLQFQQLKFMAKKKTTGEEDKSSSSPSPPAGGLVNKVVIGGTFDILHRGHEALLRRAFSLGETTIGLTSNKMAEKIKRRRVGNFRSRKKELEKFIKKWLPGEEDKSSSSPFATARVGKYKIKKIEDKFGPTLKEDFDYIVVSPETYKTALLINKKRQKIKKKPIKIVKIKFVLGENGKPISTTRIIKGKHHL